MAEFPVVLTVAASDPLGGAGVQADLATFAALGVHGASAVTAVTAQSLTEVTAVAPVDADVVAAQIDEAAAVFEVAAVKTGLLRRAEVVELVAARVADGALPAPVVDPVMVDGRGVRFVDEAVVSAYREALFPLARVVTPNRAEAELLVGAELVGSAAVVERAEAFRALGADVVVTGGGFDGPPDDVIVTGAGVRVYPGRRVRTDNVRGSGCTFSAALAASLALGSDLAEAAARVGDFVRRAIEVSAGWDVGGPGPVAHVTLSPCMPPA